MRLSLHDPEKLGQKYINEPELWLETEELVRNVLIETGVPFVEVKGEGAFYGPKIDVQILERYRKGVYTCNQPGWILHNHVASIFHLPIRRERT